MTHMFASLSLLLEDVICGFCLHLRFRAYPEYRV